MLSPSASSSSRYANNPASDVTTEPRNCSIKRRSNIELENLVVRLAPAGFAIAASLDPEEMARMPDLRCRRGLSQLNASSGECGLRLVSCDRSRSNSSKSYFDTNNTKHHHYYLEDRHELLDIPRADVAVGNVPVPPAGYEIVRVDVVVRLRRKTINSAPN